jgi:polysaccharide deacetylase family protein (PEP-CTERM system associated)
VSPVGVNRHFFTVDVEEHYMVLALAPFVARESWDRHDSRVEGSTRRILELMGRHTAQGTFFIVGWVAERHPALVKEIAASGHEVASHTWDHRRVTEQSPEEFRTSVRRTKDLLEDLTGTPCVGFRAPSYSIVRGTEWALDVLLEEGYRYDSSLFPVRRPGYGYQGGARDPHWLERPAGRIAEVPPATVRRLGVNLPAAGGAYFRLLPYRLVATGLRDAAARGQPGTFYVHPWELDPGQPRLARSPLVRWRHYGRLGATAARLERLLAEFAFRAIAPDFGVGASAVEGQGRGVRRP